MSLVVNSQPQPALVGFGKDKTPHFIQFRFLYFFEQKNIILDFMATLPLPDILQIDRAYEALRFFKVLITFFWEMPNTREVSRIPEAFAAIATIFSSIPRSQPV